MIDPLHFVENTSTELAHLALWLLWALLAQHLILSCLVTTTAEQELSRVKNRVSSSVVVLITTAGVLIWALLRNDYSLQYVWANSSDYLAWYYRLAALWAGNEGAWMLWCTVFACYVLLYASQQSGGKGLVLALNYGCILIFIYLSYLLFYANPMLRILPLAPVQGQDLNPLLQDPGMVFHPPLLYAGYTAMAIPCVHVLRALRHPELFTQKQWQQQLSIWSLWAWLCLTAAIALGSWWAYRQLGWGGWWFWDPVENCSLVLWLCATALIHTRAHGQYESGWVILYACLGLILSLGATALVRSGLLVSVHSFALDFAQGYYMLAVFGLIIIGIINEYRGYVVQKYRHNEITLSWMLHYSLLGSMIWIVILGILYPIISEYIYQQRVAVGSEYYQYSLVVFVVLLLMSMGWKALQLVKVSWSMHAVLMSASTISTMLVYCLFSTKTVASALWIQVVVLACIWSLLAHGYAWRYGARASSYHSMFKAHVACAGLLLVAVINRNYEQAWMFTYTPGASIAIAGTDLQLAKIKTRKSSHYDTEKATINVNGDSTRSRLTPSIHYYHLRDQVEHKAAILQTWLEDIIVTIARPDATQSALLRVQKKPLQLWLWTGALCLVVAGLNAYIQALQRNHIRSKAMINAFCSWCMHKMTGLRVKVAEVILSMYQQLVVRLK